MADITSQDILTLFTAATSVHNSDQFLIQAAEAVQGNRAVKVTAEAVRAYLLQHFSITVSEDGYLVIGGEKTTTKAEGVTPVLERRTDGIYCTIDHGATYTCVAYYSDFGYTNVIDQTATTVNIAPNVLNRWGEKTSLVLTLLAGSQGAMNEYMLQFTVSGNSFTLNIVNADIRWVEEPEFTDGNTYQVSIVDGLAIAAEWEAATS